MLINVENLENILENHMLAMVTAVHIRHTNI